MICPVCRCGFESIRGHFSKVDDEQHKKYLLQDIEKAKTEIQSLFYSDLPIRKIRYKIKQYEYVCICSNTFVKNTWIETFGIDAFNKKIQLIEKNRAEKQRRTIIRNCKMNRIRFDVDIINIEKEVEIACYKKDSFKQVKQRDIICQECGEKDKKLDVHHIVPRRLFERYDFEQHSPDNLILLCDKCHSTVGQELDEVMIDIFKQYIKMMFPVTYEYILYKLSTRKKVKFKRKVGTPKLYNITVDDINKIKNDDGVVNITNAMELMPKTPRHQIVKACKDNKVTYVNPECLTKNLKTKICPVAACGWSGSFKFSNHVVNSDDEQHKVFIENLRRLYLDEKLGCEDIANKYCEYNFTREIVEKILKDVGIYYKILEEVV